LIARVSFDENLPFLGIRIILAIVINAAFALLAWQLRQITLSGAAVGFFLGVAIYMGFGYSWKEAVGNLLPAAWFSILVITTPYQPAFLMAVVAALAEAAGDTVASETGKWLSSKAWLITTLKPVPAGEDGGITLRGTAAGIVASALIVLLGYGLNLMRGWNIVVVLLAAVAGNLADSVLGATLERRGLVTNAVVNFAGTGFAGTLALGFALHHR
jgi:uncharacterized protein (TIGR00297 family)